MHDGTQLEQRGVPTAVVVTEPFLATARAVAELDGLPGYRVAVVPHPTADLAGEALLAVARLAADQVEQILLGP